MMYKENHDKQFPFQIGEHIDCQDTVGKWLNAEIVAIRDDNQIKVHYTGWNSKWDEWVPINSNRILKQWKNGYPIFLNNRLDIQEINILKDKWLEAKVIDLDEQDYKKIRIHFIGYHPKYDEWVHIDDTQRVAEVGRFSDAAGQASIKTDKDSIPEKYKEFLKKIQQREKQFKQDLMKEKQLVIKIVEGDGNCLFRSFSDQIYGTDQYYNEIRNFCMDYITLEKFFFKDYIINGEYGFQKYVESRRKDGVWGDDVEIQALSEIYDRPVELYGYSLEPMRTFHESNQKNLEPIRLSFHGQCHYNSVKQMHKEFQGFLKIEEFGIIEKQSIINASQRKQMILQNKAFQQQQIKNENVQIQDKIINSTITLSRKEFEEVGKRNMEQALEESLKPEYQQNMKSNSQKKDVNDEIEDRIFEFVKKEAEDKWIEDEYFKTLLKQSEQQYMDDIIKKVKIQGYEMGYQFYDDDIKYAYYNIGRTVQEITTHLIEKIQQFNF